ncbi:MAG TPA: tRNA (adenosine(37)-N6)-threonylcarbamoyltransferase complex transferase subunit TsaD [Candidatus Brocadiia bacterium]|nr:tRNA (adenosine(37)-N6)-threonylcarbamoyltransferase complex transferase subunit TsaD [Candidatus Brocadiia bacterium]
MLVLGIETSCDETSASVVRDGREVLSNIVASQIDLHSRFGGVVPELACRAHVEQVLPIIESALQDAGIALGDIDVIAVTSKPGLIGALLIGVSAAKSLAWAAGKPLVGVNHIHAHAYANWLENPDTPYPAVALVASGGHTSLLLCSGPAEYRLLGATNDDAAGEAFDKVAKLLGLGYPGGPIIDKLGKKGNPKAVDFPRPMLGKDSLDFSFSGLKTAALYTCYGQDSRGGPLPMPNDLSEERVADIAASFQEALIDVLVAKTVRAADLTGVREIVVGGGVACNSRLRAKMGEAAAQFGLRMNIPSLKFCTDNAAMIAGLAFHSAARGEFAQLDLDASPSY